MPPNLTTSSLAAATSRFRVPYLKGGRGDNPKNSTYPIPPVRGDSVMTLADVVGATAARQIEATGQLIFHSVGYTGRGPHTAQQAVAEAMARDIDPAGTTKVWRSCSTWAT